MLYAHMWMGLQRKKTAPIAENTASRPARLAVASDAPDREVVAVALVVGAAVAVAVAVAVPVVAVPEPLAEEAAPPVGCGTVMEDKGLC
jgi:hypothetical protein